MGTFCLKIPSAGDESAIATVDPTVVYLLSCNLTSLSALSFSVHFEWKLHIRHETQRVKHLEMQAVQLYASSTQHLWLATVQVQNQT